MKTLAKMSELVHNIGVSLGFLFCESMNLLEVELQIVWLHKWSYA